jgi:hypothetical protein
LILWLANDELSRRLPRSLRRLQRRGLEIRYCDDYRSYKKVYPFAGSEPEHVRPYATADDDVLYPKGWLEGLCDAWSERPELVNGYRARRIRISGGVIAPYVEWEKVLDSHPSHSNFLTGVSGIIYPPAFLDRLREAGDRFQLLSPEADDVWLHHVALRASTMQRQVRSEPLEFPTIPFTQRSTLMATNVGAGMNDRQIASLYSQADIQRLSDS